MRTSRASTAADRLEQLPGARVRRLAALHDGGHPEIPEDRRQALPGDDRDDAQGEGGRRGGRPMPPGDPVSAVGLGRRERRGPRLADVARLVVEVLDADPAERAEGQAVADHEVGPLVVDVDLEGPRIAGDQHRLADRLEVDPDRVDVERARTLGQQQEHRLVAEPFVGMGDQRRRPGAGLGAAPCGGRRCLADEVEQRPLEEAVQALPARVHDPGLAQDREERRGPRDRLLGRVDGRREHGLEVLAVLRGRDGGVRRFADHGQDGALDRLGDGGIGGLRGRRERVGQVEAVEPLLALEALGHPAEDLAGDDPRVAAGAHQRPEADGGRHAVDRLPGGRLGLFERRAYGGEHVRAGVAVGDRVDVEGVDLVDVGLEVGDGRPEGREQAGPVTGPADHQATSVPLSARSRVLISVGSAWATTGGAPPGWTRSPSMWITSRRTSQVERPLDRVADGRVDLARHLGDGHAQRHLQVELHVEAVVDADGDPGMGQVDEGEETGERAAGQARDPVRAEGRTTDHVRDRAARHERSARRLSGWHAGDVLLARRVGRRPAGASVAVWYRNASVRTVRGWTLSDNPS